MDQDWNGDGIMARDSNSGRDEDNGRPKHVSLLVMESGVGSTARGLGSEGVLIVRMVQWW